MPWTGIFFDKPITSRLIWDFLHVMQADYLLDLTVRIPGITVAPI
jgi:hypothetical protein